MTMAMTVVIITITITITIFRFSHENKDKHQFLFVNKQANKQNDIDTHKISFSEKNVMGISLLYKMLNKLEWLINQKDQTRTVTYKNFFIKKKIGSCSMLLQKFEPCSIRG